MQPILPQLPHETDVGKRLLEVKIGPLLSLSPGTPSFSSRRHSVWSKKFDFVDYITFLSIMHLWMHSETTCFIILLRTEVKLNGFYFLEFSFKIDTAWFSDFLVITPEKYDFSKMNDSSSPISSASSFKTLRWIKWSNRWKIKTLSNDLQTFYHLCCRLISCKLPFYILVHEKVSCLVK